MKARALSALLCMLVVLLCGTAMTVVAQDQINLGDGLVNAHFNGNETPLITLLIPTSNCSGSVCYMANGSASGTGHLQSSGTYTVFSPSNAPFYLTHQADNSFRITQTSPIYFNYSSQRGTLGGNLSFASISQTNSQLISTMTGTLTSATGSFARYFPDGGNVSIAVGLTFPLQTLYTVNGFSAVEFQNGTITTANHCGGHNHQYWTNNPGQWQHGQGLTIGGNQYSDNQVEGLLQASEQNDASMYLVHRLIGALLNVNNNLKGDPVQTYIDDANNLLGTTQLPQQINPNSSVGQQMLGDASILDSYNNNYVSTAASH
jgi:hypothetical protein